MVRIYNSGHKGDCRSERAEQIDCISWLSFNYPDEYALIFHCPNESAGNAFHHSMRHKEGVKPGIPDIIHLGGTDQWRSGLFELKRLDARKSKVSAEQKAILELADARGSFAAICYGFECFKLAWIDYLGK